ncbi:MAG: hypothetical protein ACR2J3_13375 [Aridibacter sp.]
MTSEPIQPRKNIDPENWKGFLEEFSERNNDRRASFDLFKADGEILEENLEAHFEEARLETNGGKKNVVITRIDRADAKADKFTNEVTNVRRIGVQYDTDGSEDALEITDDQNSLISLRFESKVDGGS